MGSSNSKVQCLLRPGQSGKTRTVQDIIREYEEYAKIFLPDGNLPINVVIVSNNRSLVHQTTVRMNKDLFEDTIDSDSDSVSADAHVEGNCFSWVSGTKDSTITPEHLAFQILSNQVSMVVCCAHKKRFDYLFKLIGLLKAGQLRRRVNLWIDEADASINLWSRPEFDVTLLPNVGKVTLVSATFNSILKKYERLHVLGYAVTHLPIYHKVTDCVVEEDNTKGDALAYLEAALERHPGWLNPGMRMFAPGDHTQSSHDELATLLVEKGCAVLILNGARKCILVPNASPIKLADHVIPANPEEIGKLMARLYHEYNLSRFPFAVTGHDCVGRGLTFQNDTFVFNDNKPNSVDIVVPTFIFDVGIVPHINDHAMAYQTACRLAGNIKNFNGYKASTLVMSEKMWTIVRRQEMFAVNLAKIVQSRNLEDVGQEEFDEAAGEDGRDYELSPTFETAQEAKSWCERKLTYPSSEYRRHIETCDNARCTGCGMTHIKYRGKTRALLSEADLRRSVDMGQGANTSARVMPVSWIGTPEAADKARIMPVDIRWGIADSARIMPLNGEPVLRWITIYKKDKLRAFKVSELFGRK
jgi:hypothetical protein